MYKPIRMEVDRDQSVGWRSSDESGTTEDEEPLDFKYGDTGSYGPVYGSVYGSVI